MARAGGRSARDVTRWFGHDLAAGRLELGDQRVRDGRRPAPGHRPADRMGVGREDQPERGTQRAIEAEHRVGGDPGEQGPRRVVTEPRPGQALGRSQGRQPEPGQRQRVARDVRHGPQDLRADPRHVADQRPEQPPPRPSVGAAQAFAGGRHGSIEHGRPPAIERMCDRHVRVDDLDAAGGEVDRGEERGGESQRQDRRAHIVAEPGQRQLHRPRPATGLRGGLIDADRASGPGQGDGRGQPVRAGPDDDRIDHRSGHERVAARRGPTPKGMAFHTAGQHGQEDMMDTIGAAVWSTGRAGRVIVEAGLTRPWLEFRGGIVYAPAKEGLDLGEACGLDVRLGAPVSTDVDAVLARSDIDVVFYCGIGTPAEVAAACLRANRAGKDAITISGLVHPATILGASAAAELDAASRATGQRILGTGFWDYLTISLPLTSLSNVLTYDEIRLERIADTSLWGHGILRDEGIGGPVASAGGGFMMRNFLVEALMLLAESSRPGDR